MITDAFLSYYAIPVVTCLFLGIATILSLAGFAFCKDKSIDFRGHWGGFGSGTRGWKFSRSLSFLIASMVFSVLLAVVAISAPVRQGDEGVERNRPSATNAVNKQPDDNVPPKETPNKDAAKALPTNKK